MRPLALRAEISILSVLAVLAFGAGCGKSDKTTSQSESSASATAKNGEAVPGAATPTTTSTGAAAGKADAPEPAKAGDVFSCTHAEAGFCAEWHGVPKKEAKGSCSDKGDVFSEKPCPTAGVIATCEHPDENVKMFIKKSPVVTSLKEAKELCDDGKFTPLATK